MATRRREPQRNDVRKYKKPWNINIGMVIFSCIFVYIIICIFMYFTNKHISGYEVKMGTLSVSNIYKGIAIRDEEIIPSNNAGYVNYFAREGDRVGVGNVVYAVDETGKLNDYIVGEGAEENALDQSDLIQIKSDIVAFTKDFEPSFFSSIYDFKFNMKGNLMKLSNLNVLDSLSQLKGTLSQNAIRICNAANTGIVVYNMDGYEELTPNDINADVFNLEQYKKEQLISNELVEVGDPVYKLVKDENWSLVIPIEKERIQELEEAEYVQVRFLKNQDVSWAKVTILSMNGENYAQLDFNNSMITFCTDRFVDIELITEEEAGLKIPNSSIAEKEFFLVPSEYIVRGGEKNSSGILKEVYKEDGSTSTEYIDATIYNEEDGQCYLDDSIVKTGEQLIKPDSNEKYTVSKKGTLIGVYNMNKGYADFKQILILYQNQDYSIVKSNTKYGLNVYDHIVLDANSVNEDDFIY